MIEKNNWKIEGVISVLKILVNTGIFLSSETELKSDAIKCKKSFIKLQIKWRIIESLNTK